MREGFCRPKNKSKAVVNCYSTLERSGELYPVPSLGLRVLIVINSSKITGASSKFYKIPENTGANEA